MGLLANAKLLYTYPLRKACSTVSTALFLSTLAHCLQATPGDSQHRAVRIVPSWVPAHANGSAAVDPIFVGYRTGQGVDRELFDSMKHHVLVYTSPVNTARDPRYTTLRASLAGGQACGLGVGGMV